MKKFRILCKVFLFIFLVTWSTSTFCIAMRNVLLLGSCKFAFTLPLTINSVSMGSIWTNILIGRSPPRKKTFAFLLTYLSACFTCGALEKVICLNFSDGDLATLGFLYIFSAGKSPSRLQTPKAGVRPNRSHC